jgi:hypothetical protein
MISLKRCFNPCCQLISMHMQGGGGGGSPLLMNHTTIIELQSHFQLSDRLLIVRMIRDTVKWLIWACLSVVPIITIRCLLVWWSGNTAWFKHWSCWASKNWPNILHPTQMHAALKFPIPIPPCWWLATTVIFGTRGASHLGVLPHKTLPMSWIFVAFCNSPRPSPSLPCFSINALSLWSWFQLFLWNTLASIVSPCACFPKLLPPLPPPHQHPYQ